MPRQSAGLLLYRFVDGALQVFLVHPGGPFWAGKDAGAWSIPKGEFTAGEEPLAAAKREFHEETSFEPPELEPFVALTPIKQKGGKVVHAWACPHDFDASQIHSNEYSVEWPPKSRKYQRFPEVDMGGWFSLAEARIKINLGQVPLLDELAQRVGG